MYFSQLSNSLACKFQYCFHWTRFSFLSDSPLCPGARLRSTEVIRTACSKTIQSVVPSLDVVVRSNGLLVQLQFFGRNTTLSIHCRPWRRQGSKEAEICAYACRQRNIGLIWRWGRNGSAINFLIYLYIAPSSEWALCRPISCTRKQT